MSQDSREKIGVKTQVSIGGEGGGGRGGREGEKKRKDMLKAGQSRGSIVCVIKYKTLSIVTLNQKFPVVKNDTTHI